ncbi:hypothetical protein TMUPMC115_0966 [Tetragenococcus muriaticus PMC-11-5]|uniref:Uncharacterized protein n=2 Tax=Tetragenococcus muriaticus TaxID=64642 RepID=A0A091C6D9_9ENTE|nr:hypothetical protein TMUPMC115_0966 [Tetragenococcus muriaticus PMC-11-5]
MQSNRVEKVRTELSSAQQTIVELQETVKNGNLNVQNQIQAILEDLQIIGQQIPSDERMNEIEQSIENVQKSVANQIIYNRDFEERIQKLEQANEDKE